MTDPKPPDDGWGDEDSPEPDAPELSAPKETPTPTPTPTPATTPIVKPEVKPAIPAPTKPGSESSAARRAVLDDDLSRPGVVSAPIVSGRRTLLVFGIGAFVLLTGVIIVLSWMNSYGFYFVCEAKQIVGQRGRWVPWGHAALEGDEWKPIVKPPDARCSDRRFDTIHELREAFATALLKRANTTLAAATKDRISSDALKLADEQLVQALLLLAGAEQADQRKEIERLQGDVEYWRAAADVREAIANLNKAGERFQDAAARGPRHAGDSQTWGEYARELADQLRQGPPKLRPEQPPPPGTPPPFAGTGAIVGPPAPSGSRSDTPDTGVEEQAPRGDAGPPPIPRGGVLL